MVGPNGLEPSTSSVSGRRSNQLSYGPTCQRYLQFYGRQAIPATCVRCLRIHGLIAGWKFLCVLSSCMEIMVVRALLDSWFLPCQGSALTRLSYGPTSAFQAHFNDEMSRRGLFGTAKILPRSSPPSTRRRWRLAPRTAPCRRRRRRAARRPAVRERDLPRTQRNGGRDAAVV